MKELSIEQKAKAYEEALERASKLRVQNPFDTVSQMMEHVFPELKESEDEKIKRFLICGMHAIKEQKKKTFATIPIDDVIAWLKKQGEKQGKSALEAIKGEKVDNTNKVEPKSEIIKDTWYICTCTTCSEDSRIWFKKGIAYLGNDILKCDLGVDPNDYQDYFRIWTIHDARNGDILAWDDSQCIALFKNIEDKLSFNGHGCVGHCTGVFEAGWSYHDIEGAHPATKEQHDILFAKMKEAGYKWDAEKKELKKIEQKPAWSEEDEVRLGEAICVNEANGTLVRSEDAVKNISNWLKSLKQRIGWKPSEEQVRALRDMLLTGDMSGGRIQILIELCNDLDKLKGG